MYSLSDRNLSEGLLFLSMSEFEGSKLIWNFRCKFWILGEVKESGFLYIGIYSLKYWFIIVII